jgi:hypothetical protein
MANPCQLDERPSSCLGVEGAWAWTEVQLRRVPGSAQVLQDGKLHEPEQLARVFKGAGVDLAKPIVTSCGTGVTASVLALALHQLSLSAQVRAGAVTKILQLQTHLIRVVLSSDALNPSTSLFNAFCMIFEVQIGRNGIRCRLACTTGLGQSGAEGRTPLWRAASDPRDIPKWTEQDNVRHGMSIPVRQSEILLCPSKSRDGAPYLLQQHQGILQMLMLYFMVCCRSSLFQALEQKL